MKPELEYFPCRCLYRHNVDGTYTHYVNPDCEFDNTSHPHIEGYEYIFPPAKSFKRLWKKYLEQV